MHSTRTATWSLRVALTALITTAMSASGAEAPIEPASVSIQIANPDGQTPIRVRLDNRVIFESRPPPLTSDGSATARLVVGPFSLDASSRHALIAEAPGAGTRAQLEWTPRREGSAWIVIHYYPGRSDSATPPFFTFALQAAAYKRH